MQADGVEWFWKPRKKIAGVESKHSGVLGGSAGNESHIWRELWSDRSGDSHGDHAVISFGPCISVGCHATP